MRISRLAGLGLASVLSLAACGNDNGVSPKSDRPMRTYAESREDLTNFTRAHYNSRDRFPGVDSVVVNDGDVLVYGRFLDSRRAKSDTTEVRTDSTLTTTRTRETPRVNRIVVDIEPFNQYGVPSLRLEEDPRFETGGRIPMEGIFLGAILDVFYDSHSEMGDGPDSWWLWIDFGYGQSYDLLTEVGRRLVK